jgi:hypothetical protein
VPEERRIAEAYSRGEAIVGALPEYRRVFDHLWAGLQSRASGTTTTARSAAHADV